MLTPQVVSDIVRHRLGMPDDSQAARIIMLIPEALKSFGRMIAADPDTRQLLTTNPLSTKLPIGNNGAVDLSSGYGQYKFLLEYIDRGLMYWSPGAICTPYLLNIGTSASGVWVFAANPPPGDTILVNGVTFTFVYAPLTVAGAGSGVNAEYLYGGITPNSQPYWYRSDQGNQYTDYAVSSGVSTPGLWWEILQSGELNYVENQDGDHYQLPTQVRVWTTGGDSGAVGSLPVPTVRTSVTTPVTNVQVALGSSPSITATNFAAALNASANTNINIASYTVISGRNGPQVQGTVTIPGTSGNSFTMATSASGAVTVSGATFVGGTNTNYSLSIPRLGNRFASGSRVQFTSTGSLPTGISALTDYYLFNYTPAGNGATFRLASDVHLQTPISITSAGSGVLTMIAQDALATPLQRITPQQASLSRQYLESVFDYIEIQGNILTLLPKNGVYQLGNIAFAVPYYPQTLAQMPNSEEAERMFLQIITDMAAMPTQDV